MHAKTLSIHLALLFLSCTVLVHAAERIPSDPVQQPAPSRAVPAKTEPSLPAKKGLPLVPPSTPPAPAPVKGLVKVMSPTAKWHTSGSASVACPPGKKVLGGGYYIVGRQNRIYIDDKFYVTVNRPTDNDAGWQIMWFSSGKENFWVNVYAICADEK